MSDEIRQKLFFLGLFIFSFDTIYPSGDRNYSFLENPSSIYANCISVDLVQITRVWVIDTKMSSSSLARDSAHFDKIG